MASYAVEAHFARRDADGRQRAHIGANGGEIGEQLRMREMLAVPVHRLVSAALVVEDRKAAVGERIDAIDAQAKLRACEQHAQVVLNVAHAKVRASALKLAQRADEQRRTALLAPLRRRRTGRPSASWLPARRCG